MNIQKYRKVSARQGWYWINNGFRYFMQAKYMWIMTVFLFVTVILLSRYLGPLIQMGLILLLPFITAGLSLACADIEKGKKMSVLYLFKGFKCENKSNIFRYGLLFFVMLIVAQILSSIILNISGISQDQISNEILLLQNNNNAGFQDIYKSPVLFSFFSIALITMLPVIMINFFAPIILIFSNLSAIEAIKLGFFGAIKNLSALIVYAAIYMFILFVGVVVFNMLITLLFSVFGDNSLIAMFVYFFLFLLFLLSVIAISYSSAYVAYKEIFLGEQN